MLPFAPDAGAWVYAFPVENATGKKLSADWFQADNPDRIAALQILGGNAVQADAKGQFELSLLRPGKYLLLVSSGNKTTKTTADPPEVLQNYFDDPQAILKTHEFRSQDFEFEGQKTQLDFEFL